MFQQLATAATAVLQWDNIFTSFKKLTEYTEEMFILVQVY